MEEYIFSLIDQKKRIKVRTYQNLALMASAITLVTAIVFSAINNLFLSNVAAFLILLFIPLVILFLILWTLTPQVKNIGTAIITNQLIKINTTNQQFETSINNVEIILNLQLNGNIIDLSASDLTENVLNWGNYMTIHHKGQINLRVEFEPNLNLQRVIPLDQIQFKKDTAILSGSTADLLKNIGWVIWGAS